MAHSIKKREISLVGSCIEVLVLDAINPNAPENYNLADVKSIIPSFQENVGINGIDNAGTYPYKDRKRITITFSGESGTPSLSFDLEEISNQPGWTLDLAGVIQAVSDINSWITTATGSPSGLATEATLLSILNNMVASQDVEILLVRDTGAADVVVQQIREYDQGTGVWTTRYEDVSGGAYVPVGPLEYLDPSAILNLVLTELQSLNVSINPAARTSNIVIATGAGSIPAGAICGSVMNTGGANGTFLGQVILPGMSIPIPLGHQGDTYGAMAYDGTGTSLTIQYTN